MAKFYRFNPKGEILVEKTFDEVSYPFGKLREFVPVKKGKKWGVALNDSLELVIPVRYDRIASWVESKPNIIMAWEGESALIIDVKNNLIISNQFSHIYLKNNNDRYAVVALINKKGIIDEEGKIIIEPKFDNCEIISDDRFLIYEENSVILANNNGEYINQKIIADWVHAQFIKINNAYVIKYFLFRIKEKHYGVVDNNFNLILDCKYDHIKYISNDTFFAILNGKNIVLNNQNIIIKEFSFNFRFGGENLLKSGKYNYIIRKDSSYGAKCGIINEIYELVLPIDFDWIDFSNDIWNVRKGRSEYILDENYNLILNSKYKNIGKFEEEGIACAQGEDFKYTFINKSGVVIINKKFDSVQLGRRSLLDFLFSNINSSHKSGLCGVCLNSKWGYVDLNGQLVIECKFDEITEFDSRNIAIVKYKGYWGIINQDEKTVIDFKYDIIKGYDKRNNVIAKFDGNWGVTNQENEIIIDFKYDNIIDYNIDSKTIICKIDDLIGMIDFDKNELISYSLIDLNYNEDGTLFGYSKKPLYKKLPISKSIEPIELLNSKLLEKHNTLIHEDLIRVMVMAIVSGEEDDISNRLYIIDVIKKDNISATFISGYAGGGVWDECTFINELEYKGEKGGFTVFDYIRDDQVIKELVGDYICEIDDELDEYQYKSLNHFVKVGDEDLKLLYSVWYNDLVDYSDISKNDKKRFKKLMKSTGGIKWKDWNFKF